MKAELLMLVSSLKTVFKYVEIFFLDLKSVKDFFLVWEFMGSQD